MSTKLELKSRWNKAKGKLKQKYGQLTDSNLSLAEGKTDDRALEIVGEVWSPSRSEWICVSRSFLPTA